MCGIAAIFADSPIRQDDIRCLTSLVSHRGPDGLATSMVSGDLAAFGHARLAIQDLHTRADQPMHSPDGRHIIVFNGEVYNFHELRTRLQAEGVEFLTQSDTEVILHAWRRWGARCLHEFNGMWAFVVYDTVTREVAIARDRFGVKPVYFIELGTRLIVCSEADAIGKFCRGDVKLDSSFVSGLLEGNTAGFGSTTTHLAGVHAVPAGCILRFGADRVLHHERWYHFQRCDVPKTFSEQCEAFRELLLDSCRLRLRSDVPIATCLSGGIDSGSIVCALNWLRTHGDSVGAFSHRSFTAAFPGTWLDETELTRTLAAQNQIQLDQFTVECPDGGTLESAMQGCDGPMPALAFYPIWALYRHIKSSGISVTLDGQGADEMLGGYYIGPDALISGWQSRNPFRMLDLWRTYAMLHASGPEWMRSAVNTAKAYACGEVQLLLKAPLKSIGASIGIYKPRPNRMPRPLVRPEAVSCTDPDHGDWLAHKLWSQFFVNPLPFLLHQYDRCSMASGVECRMPFMDYRLVEFLFSCPLTTRVGAGYTKRILRHSMRGLLPEPIRTNRIKTGFNAPFSTWLKGPLREWVRDCVRSREFIESEYFDGKSIFQSLERADWAPDSLDERQIWPCLHLTWWIRQSRQSNSAG